MQNGLLKIAAKQYLGHLGMPSKKKVHMEGNYPNLILTPSPPPKVGKFVEFS